MAMIGKGNQLPLPSVEPDEPVDILSFVVTKAGWESLKSRIKISSSNTIRILTQLIYKSAINPIKQSRGDWHYLPGNHAKVILYRKQKVAVLGSFNLTKPSLGNNIECFSQVDPADYDRLANEFNRLWEKTKQDDIAIKTRTIFSQAIADTFYDGEEEELNEEAPLCEAEPTDGPREPWSFQEDIIQQVMDWLDTARDADLGRIVKLPTGAGKTVVAAEVIRRLLEKRPQARILWVCHRVELLRQSWDSIYRQINRSIPETTWFVPQHIEDESGVKFRLSKGRQVVFCTQGLLPCLLRHNREKRFDLTIVDECHRFHPQSKTYRVLDKYCRAGSVPRLGLTATPLDHDKRNFGQYWNTESMFGTDLTEEFLVGEGFLSRKHPTLTKQRKTGFTFVCKKEHAGPEHVESELVTRVKEFDDPIINDEVARAWQEYRSKRQRVLCFAVTIEHAETLKEEYFAKDDRVRMVHSKLTPEQQSENLEWFKEISQESRMLISVLMLTEGIDLPKTDCLFMVRPTFSKELHQQMIGRGLRGPKAEGTEDCAVVDFTSQYVDRNGRDLQFAQVTTNNENDVTAGVDGSLAEEEEEPDDLDASGMTANDLREAVDELRDNKEMTVHDACEELAQERNCPIHTLVTHYYTKVDDYALEWEDPEAELAEQSDDSSAAADRGSEVNGARAALHNIPTEWRSGSEVYVTRIKLRELRAHDPQRFEEIASLTNVASSTLRSYCSDQKNFKRWKTNNKDNLDQVRVILAESLAQHSDAA